MTSQINACRSGAFPTMVEEDEDESPHVNMDETLMRRCRTQVRSLTMTWIVKSTTSLLRRMTAL
jgi:hypothetical protein